MVNKDTSQRVSYCLMNKLSKNSRIHSPAHTTKNLLVTFHPVTLESATSARQMRVLLAALGEIKDTHLIFTMPNADIGGDIIFKLMSTLLGSEFICGSYCASRLLPGSPGQELHIDYPYWDYYKSDTFPMGLNSSFAQNCQATIPLDICSVESGATAYIPGSQKKLKYPNQNDDFSNKQQMVAKPGDLVFFNGNCWHGASPNKSDHQRAALLIEFLPKYIKPVEDLISYLNEEFKKNSNNKVRQLLGLNYEYPKIMDVSKKTNNIGIGYQGKNK